MLSVDASMNIFRVAGLGVVFSLLTAAGNVAAPLTPGNVVVIDTFYLGDSLLEYRPDGTLVQNLQIPHPNFARSAGGLTFDDQGLLWV